MLRLTDVLSMRYNGLVYSDDNTQKIIIKAYEDFKESNLPSSVIRIGECAFQGHKSIRSLENNLGMSYLQFVDDRAFYDSSIESITFPQCIKIVGKEAFAHCANLRSVTFQGSNVEVSPSAFNDCKNLKVIKIPIGAYDKFKHLRQKTILQEVLFPESFCGDNLLFHYTKFDNALKIILSNKIRFGDASEMNDINEVFRAEKAFDAMNGIMSSDVEKRWYKAFGKWKQFSFTTSKGGNTEPFNISALWGHYADKGYGVCLIFSKQKLINYLCKVYKKRFYNNVEYTNNVEVLPSDVSNYTDDDIKNIFFKKNEDWAYEQEYRVLVKTKKEIAYLDYKDALVGVILCRIRGDDKERRESKTYSIWNSDEYKMLKKAVDPDVVFLLYHYFADIKLLDDVNKFNYWIDHDIYNEIFGNE